MANVVCYGEILWDILPAGAKPGGAPMNVAYHLQKLGVHASLISRIGTDQRGTDLLSYLLRRGVETKHIQYDQQQPTGIVNAYLKENNQVEYDIVYPAAWDFIEVLPESEELVTDADYFVFGSLACRNDISKKSLLQLLNKANTKVLDINLRPPHYTQSLVEELMGSADILKLNDVEINLINSWYRQPLSIEDAIKSLAQQFSLKTILVTCGANGAIAYQDGTIYQHDGYKVNVSDTVGSGDAFLAGYLSQQAQNKTPQEALSFANALGAFIATKEGACPDYVVSEVTALQF